jgi:hypothetical protein
VFDIQARVVPEMVIRACDVSAALSPPGAELFKPILACTNAQGVATSGTLNLIQERGHPNFADLENPVQRLRRQPGRHLRT